MRKFFAILICLVCSVSGQDDPVDFSKIKDHIGLISGIAVAVPLCVAGVLAINKDRYDGPQDSVLYFDKDREPYTVGDHNSDVTIKMGTFVLADFLVCATVGYLIDKWIVDKREKKKAAKVLIVPDIHKKQCSISVLLTICLPQSRRTGASFRQAYQADAKQMVSK